MDEPPEFHAINTGHTVELAMHSRPGGTRLSVSAWCVHCDYKWADEYDPFAVEDDDAA